MDDLKKEKLSVTRGSCEVYYLRFDGRHEWADIYIDSSGKQSGSIMIRSDFGDWSNFWSHCGTSFKQFLTEIDDDYFMKKVAKRDHFDSDRVLKQFRLEILERRRNSYISSQEAREAWIEVDSLNDGPFDEGGFWHNFMENSDIIHEKVYCNDSEGLPTGKDFDPGLYSFMEIWHHFQDLIKKELALEVEVKN